MFGGPPGKHLREPAGIFVVSGHSNSSHGALALEIGGLAGGNVGYAGWLFIARCGMERTRIVEEFEGVVGFFAPTKTCGAEEDYGVLDVLVADARKGLHVLGDDANQASVGSVEERWILVSERGEGRAGGAPLGGRVAAGTDCFTGRSGEFPSAESPI